MDALKVKLRFEEEYLETLKSRLRRTVDVTQAFKDRYGVPLSVTAFLNSYVEKVRVVDPLYRKYKYEFRYDGIVVGYMVLKDPPTEESLTIALKKSLLDYFPNLVVAVYHDEGVFEDGFWKHVWEIQNVSW